MISPIRFAARYMITGEPHQLKDAKTILEREATTKELPMVIARDNRRAMMVFTGPDAQTYRDVTASSMMDRFDRDQFYELTTDARQNAIAATDAFVTSHYNYQMIYGQPTINIETGKPLPERPGFQAALKPAPVPGKMGETKRTCIT